VTDFVLIVFFNPAIVAARRQKFLGGSSALVNFSDLLRTLVKQLAWVLSLGESGRQQSGIAEKSLGLVLTFSPLDIQKRVGF
jgi:hypothetical protein